MSLTGDPKTDYPRWRKMVFEAIQENIGPEAGECVDREGQHENVDFAISMSNRVGGAVGEAVIQITLPGGVHRVRRKWLSYEWYAHSGDPAKVAIEAIQAYKELEAHR